MDSNTHSTPPPEWLELLELWEQLEPLEPPDDLAGLGAVVDELAAQDLDRLSDTARAARVLGLRRLMDRLEGQWLKELAGVDARGAAGADQDQPVPSTAGWLRNRLRMGAGAAADAVRTARALFRGPLPQTAQAMVEGDMSPAHAKVLAQHTRQLPAHVTSAAEPVLLEAARRLDPPRLRQAVGHLLEVADPDGADAARERRHERRGLWLSPTFEGMVAVDGILEPEAGHTVLAALEPLARPADAEDSRTGRQRNADALTELARRALEGGRLPKAGGVRPQLLVTVDLDSLVGRSGGLGGEMGWAGPLDREGCRRLACDGTVTRVLSTRQPYHHSGSHHRGDRHPEQDGCADPGHDAGPGHETGPATDHGAPAPTPAPTKNPAAIGTPATPAPRCTASRGGCGPLWPCFPPPWVEHRASPWRSAGPPGSSTPPNGLPWRCGTAVVSSRVVIGPWPGATPTICGIGSMAARPTFQPGHGLSGASSAGA